MAVRWQPLNEAVMTLQIRTRTKAGIRTSCPENNFGDGQMEMAGATNKPESRPRFYGNCTTPSPRGPVC